MNTSGRTMSLQRHCDMSTPISLSRSVSRIVGRTTAVLARSICGSGGLLASAGCTSSTMMSNSQSSHAEDWLTTASTVGRIAEPQSVDVGSIKWSMKTWKALRCPVHFPFYGSFGRFSMERIGNTHTLSAGHALNTHPCALFDGNHLAPFNWPP